jgi:Spy/CpxP family protein refolding chaperone
VKISFLMVAILWVGAAVGQAPDSPNGGPGPGPGHETPAQRLDHLATLLDLTAAQKTQVETILNEEHAKMRTQHEQTQSSGQKPTLEQMKAAHEQLQQETLSKLTPVLSPTQLKKFQVWMAEQGPPGRPH